MKTQINVKDNGTAIPSTSEDPIATIEPKSDSIRDTLESIVVAFIMAFVFRAFIVEAFIIPTGSMASSLYGQHGQHRCVMCGYSFSYGIRNEIPNSNQRATLADPFSVRCPNCGWDGEGNNKLNHLPDHPVVANAGDRILVLKWPYDLGGDWLGPHRWDVVVFKDPQDGHTNFIKRLIGLPGEVLEIINGDIYTAPAKSLRPDILESLSHPPPAGPNLRKLSAEQDKALAKVLKIHRKTPVAQYSLWMIHYDHDYIPRSRHGRSGINYNPPFWEEDDTNGTPKAWNATSPKVTFTPTSGDDRIHWLTLRGKHIQDDYGYNSVNSNQIQRNQNCDVGDVRLKFMLFPSATPGEIFISLSKGGDHFTARLQPDGTTQLSRLGDGGIRIRLKETKIPPLKQGDPRDIEFENLDYRVALRIDGQEVLWTDDDQYHPDISHLLEEPVIDGRNNMAHVAIGAKGGSFQLRHLQVHRDVFYKSPRIPGRGSLLANYPGWGTATNPIYLRTDPPDYFCCGDNSPQSKDGRLWTDVSRVLMDRKNYQYGTVPGDQLIGRAFFVYWPNGLRFSRDTPRIIPNVGRMRIIR